MKNLKISFASIVVLLAIGLTLAVKADTFENKKAAPKVAPEDLCFLPSTLSDGKSICSASLEDIVASTCNIARSEFQLSPSNTFHIFALSQSSPFDIVDGEVEECPDGSVFCCFSVVEDPNPCESPNPVQPTITIAGVNGFWMVDQVYCKLP